jgi:hypothetical protein
MLLGYFLRDCQTDPRPFKFVASVEPLEEVKEHFMMVRVEADSFIRYADNTLVWIPE